MKIMLPKINEGNVITLFKQRNLIEAFEFYYTLNFLKIENTLSKDTLECIWNEKIDLICNSNFMILDVLKMRYNFIFQIS